MIELIHYAVFGGLLAWVVASWVRYYKIICGAYESGGAKSAVLCAIGCPLLLWYDVTK